MLAGPHPRSLSLGGPASPGFPPAPRSGRGRLIECSRGPTPARSHSAAPLRGAALRRATPTRLPRWGPRRLARAAGALREAVRIRRRVAAFEMNLMRAQPAEVEEEFRVDRAAALGIRVDLRDPAANA